ncbi:MAG: ABC transporter permease subunit [Deltaproteobacteria bacterium]|nr:ABC transporter permease subunit [Deltaproteobacteria bacterium]
MVVGLCFREIVQLFLHQLFVLTGAELRELLWRRRSFLSLLLYALIILLSVWLLFKVHGTLGSGHGQMDLDSAEHAELAATLDKLGARHVFELFLRLNALPSTLWIFQLFSLIWFPTLVALVSCDSIALDVYRGTLRFVLSRSSRSAYYFGKLLSHVALYCALQFVSLLTVVLYTAVAVEDFKWGESLKLAVQYFIVFVPFLWCIVAATQFVSSWSRRPMNALIRVHVMWIAFIFMLGFCPWLSPLWSKIGVGLFVPFDSYPLLTVLGYSLWGVFFTLIGMLLFTRRDV